MSYAHDAIKRLSEENAKLKAELSAWQKRWDEAPEMRAVWPPMQGSILHTRDTRLPHARKIRILRESD